MSKNQKGFSIIELVMVSSILTVISLGIVTLLTTQSREAKSFQERINRNELNNHLQLLLANSSYCGCMMRGRTVNTVANTFNGVFTNVRSSYNQPPPAYPAACTAVGGNLLPNASNLGFDVTSIRVDSLSNLGGGNYLGIFTVNFDFNDTIKALVPITIPFGLQVNTTAGTPTTRPVIGCSAISTVSNRTQAFYNNAVINNGVALDVPNLSCLTNRMAVEFGAEFIATGDDTRGDLFFSINGVNRGVRQGGSRSSGGGDITDPDTSIHGMWVGNCAGVVNLRLNWVETSDFPDIRRSYILVHFLD